MSADTHNRAEQEDHSLRLYIKQLEQWPHDRPPSLDEVRRWQREYHLGRADRDKLRQLSENHLTRAHQAQERGLLDQAIAEGARACQLLPLASHPKIVLADAYLQRSLERGYRRQDSQRAIRLAQLATTLDPTDVEAQAFLRSCRTMNADFRSVRHQKWRIPALILLLMALAAGLWQRNWIIERFSGRDTAPLTGEVLPEAASTAPIRPLSITMPSGEMAPPLEITVSRIGKWNGTPFLEIQGRLQPTSEALGEYELELSGQDDRNTPLFHIPAPIRDHTAPTLYPGDSHPVHIFRWLDAPDNLVHHVEIRMKKKDIFPGTTPPQNVPLMLNWLSPQPEGLSLSAQFRSHEYQEAYHEQVHRLTLAITNTGINSIYTLKLLIDQGAHGPSEPLKAVSSTDPPMEPGETRVWRTWLHRTPEAGTTLDGTGIQIIQADTSPP